jgi:hypothetical protein
MLNKASLSKPKNKLRFAQYDMLLIAHMKVQLNPPWRIFKLKIAAWTDSL